MTQRESRGEGPDRPVLTRRERQRLATFDEIVEIGRSMLRDGREVTLRALATEMGLTPPALYRYVKNPAALNELLSDAIFADVVREMVEAGEAYGDEDPAAQIVAAATAFRDWALDNKSEFQLVFVTNSLSGERTIRTDAESATHPLSRGVTGTGNTHGVELFADHFGGALARLSSNAPSRSPPPKTSTPTSSPYTAKPPEPSPSSRRCSARTHWAWSGCSSSPGRNCSRSSRSRSTATSAHS